MPVPDDNDDIWLLSGPCSELLSKCPAVEVRAQPVVASGFAEETMLESGPGFVTWTDKTELLLTGLALPTPANEAIPSSELAKDVVHPRGTEIRQE